jgi:hypothetical protein
MGNKKSIPTIDDIFNEMKNKPYNYIIDESQKKQIKTCAEKLYKKIEKDKDIIISKYTKLVCYILSLKQSLAHDVVDDRDINSILRSFYLNVNDINQEEFNIIGQYPSICDDLVVMPRIRNEVDLNNIIYGRRHTGKKDKTRKKYKTSKKDKKSKKRKR